MRKWAELSLSFPRGEDTKDYNGVKIESKRSDGGRRKKLPKMEMIQRRKMGRKQTKMIDCTSKERKEDKPKESVLQKNRIAKYDKNGKQTHFETTRSRAKKQKLIVFRAFFKFRTSFTGCWSFFAEG